jgi:uncharacterized protein YukE
VIRSQIGIHQRYQSDRKRTRREVESRWADAAARKYLDIVDELEQADRHYDQALFALDAALDQANQMLLSSENHDLLY